MKKILKKDDDAVLLKEEKSIKKTKIIYIFIYISAILIACVLVLAAFSIKNNRVGIAGIADVAEITNEKIIVFVGDSTSAYGAEDEMIAKLKNDNPATSFKKISLAMPDRSSTEIAEEVVSRVEKMKDIEIDVAFISLGVDDAILGTDTKIFAENARKIIGSLADVSKKIVLNCPIFLPITTTKIDTIIYCQELEKLVGGDVLLGDESVYQLFKDNVDLLSSDGIHPNDVGYKTIGEAWAKSLPQ